MFEGGGKEWVCTSQRVVASWLAKREDGLVGGYKGRRRSGELLFWGFYLI